jgi:hypothetical protein
MTCIYVYGKLCVVKVSEIQLDVLKIVNCRRPPSEDGTGCAETYVGERNQ